MRLPTLALASVLIISVPPSQQASAQTFDAATFFGQPQVGDFLLYRLNGAQTVEIRIVALQPVGGVTGSIGRWTGGPLDGLESLISFDPVFGSRLWRSFRPDLFVSGVGFVDQEQVFDPPLVASLPTITIGEVVTTNASLIQTFFTDFGTVVQSGTLQSRYRYALTESVTVPFGTFEAIQRQIQLDIELEVSLGQFSSVTVTSRDWIVPGIGTLRLEQTFPDHTDIYELLNTNREFVSEPDATAAQVTVLAVLLALSWARKRSFPKAQKAVCE